MQRYTISANMQNKLKLFSPTDEDFRKRGQNGRKERTLYLIIYIGPDPDCHIRGGEEGAKVQENGGTSMVNSVS